MYHNKIYKDTTNMAFFKSMNIDKNSDKKDNTKKSEDVEKVEILIIGSGPAGYTAGIYAARANLSPVLYQGMEAGGQLTTTTEVENFPGYPEGVTGLVMMEDLKAQAERFGTDIRFGEVTSVDFSKKPYKLTIDEEKNIEADAVIIATGATAKYLGLPSEERLKGGGVSACATCDGFFFKNKIVAVVGGGDSAIEEASYLASLASKVYVIVRKDYFRASKVMQARALDNPKIEVLFEHSTKEVLGEHNVTGVLLTKYKGTPKEEDVTIKIDGFFLGIGHTPNSEIFKPYIETDEIGYITTVGKSSRTSLAGVFACGDVQDSIYRQAITAAGSGCMAALDAEKYLKE